MRQQNASEKSLDGFLHMRTKPLFLCLSKLNESEGAVRLVTRGVEPNGFCQTCFDSPPIGGREPESKCVPAFGQQVRGALRGQLVCLKEFLELNGCGFHITCCVYVLYPRENHSELFRATLREPFDYPLTHIEILPLSTQCRESHPHINVASEWIQE